MTHTITITEEQRCELARSLDTKIRRIQAKLRWQDRLLQRGGVHADGSPCDLEKERSIYAKRQARIQRLQELLTLVEYERT